MTTPGLTDKDERLAALEAYDILDTPPEVGYDDIVALARVVCETPVALVSLVDADRQWFKARVGLEACQTDLESSVCVHALSEPDLLVIPDLAADPRTARNPLVTGDPRIRFYAGAPLWTAAGVAIGSLCTIDTVVRPQGLTDLQAEALRNLARQVMAQLELRRALKERDELIAGRAEGDRRRNALLALGDSLRDLESPEAMIRAASEIVGRTLDAARAGFGHLDPDGRSIEIVDWTAEGTPSIAGRHRFEDYGDLLDDVLAGGALVIDDVRADPRTASDPGPMLALGIGSLVNMPVRERGRTVAMLIVQDAKPRVWSSEALAFLRNVADRLEVGVARLRTEKDRFFLNQELSHRMKNMMAMVQAIAVQTLRPVPDRAPVEALLERVHALSAAHDVLLQESWASAQLSVVANSVLGRFSVGPRIDVSGPDVALGPRATLSISMLLHELATNAMKHGALSTPEGAITVEWRVEGPEGEREVVLEWRERDGPAVRPPAGRGFGSRLIRMGLIGTGGTELRYPQTGLEAVFRATLDQVSQS